MKTCPYCGKEYPETTTICAVDRTPLVAGVSEKGGPANSQPNDTGTTAGIKWIVFVVVAACLAYFVFPFTLGFCNLTQGYLMLLALLVLLGWPVTSIVVAVCMRNASVIKRISFGFVTFLTLFASFFIFPAGAKTWTLGFATHFRLTKRPAQIQQWANGVLDRYENGTLLTTTNIEYWAAGRDKIEQSEIPPQIQELWLNKPSIGIATITDNSWLIQSTQTNAESLRALTGGVATPLKLEHFHNSYRVMSV